MKKIFLIATILFITTTSCGREGPLQENPDLKRPKFDNVIDE